MGTEVPASEAARVPGHPADERWQRFSSRQIASLEAVVRALKERYPTVRAIVGHSAMPPSQKQDHPRTADQPTDPGPLFPIKKVARDVGLSTEPVRTDFKAPARPARFVCPTIERKRGWWMRWWF